MDASLYSRKYNCKNVKKMVRNSTRIKNIDGHIPNKSTGRQELVSYRSKEDIETNQYISMMHAKSTKQKYLFSILSD